GSNEVAQKKNRPDEKQADSSDDGTAQPSHGTDRKAGDEQVPAGDGAISHATTATSANADTGAASTDTSKAANTTASTQTSVTSAETTSEKTYTDSAGLKTLIAPFTPPTLDELEKVEWTDGKVVDSMQLLREF